ncbi:MAG TPA: penicillin-binding transpeptidase domain-containing protein [Bacillota bacterium]|nr:penicillin-binding transpeptidase domain-containing protein [Bacillota bacterium]
MNILVFTEDTAGDYMFKKFFKDRLDIIRIVVILIFLVMGFRLADLQLVKGEYYWKKSETLRMRNISVTAPRGPIVDKFGRLIAGNKQSYSVNIMKTEVPQNTLNDIALSVINIIEKNGDSYKDEIPILINPIRFTYQDEEINWKKKYNIPENAAAREAFAKLRLDYDIPSDTANLEAYEILRDDNNVELPFNIDEFQYDYRKSEMKWRQSNGFDAEITPEKIFEALCTKYKIPRDVYSDEKAKKILAVKYLVGQNKYKAYEPVEIAANVKKETRAEIEESRIFLPGVEIIQKPIRSYAGNEFASHIIGYMGRIGSELEELSKQGYTPQDLIGKSGIESSMEKYLKGTSGSKQIEVDVYGTPINTIKEVDPIPGDTVFLTIDSKLQKIAEDSLSKTMEEIRNGIGKSRQYVNATSGAAVAIDVNTGKILALASEPNYDPNLFAAGISNENWKMLQPESKDVYAAKPLINNAISATLPPGSTMKMISAVAGLESGAITTKETIYDKGPYTAIPGISPSCSIWKSYGTSHGYQNVTLAIKNSCNYFFFEVGRRIGGETFEKYAMKFGFGEKTGIELPSEYKGSVEGPEHKKNQYKRYLENYLINNLKIKDRKICDEIKGYIDDNPGTRQIRARLKELDITDSKAVEKVLKYISESKYQPGNVLNATIGQGLNDVTPIQLTNALAAILNGGTRYRPYLVDKVIGYDGTVKLSKQPEVVDKIEISAANLEAIKKGMYAVTNEIGGTARSAFVGSKVVISGKTGTAEAGKGYDAHAWFVAFAPYEKPEIAVGVLIFQGGHGNYPAPIARAIIEGYLAAEAPNDNKYADNDIIP